MSASFNTTVIQQRPLAVRDVSNVFRISIFVLVTLSAVALSVAEEAVFPQCLTIPIALLAYFYTERRQTLVLSTLRANLIGLLALMFSAGEWLTREWTVDIETAMLARLLAGTHLLVYLSWIVLFQQKNVRQYWWMLALSVLQIAVGSILTTQGIFGLLLLCYLFVAIWTLSLFTLHQARQQTGAAATGILSPAAGPISLDQAAKPSREILTGLIGQPSSVLGSNDLEAQRECRIGVRFVVGTLGTALASVGVAVFFFLLVPRIWIGQLPVIRTGSDSPLTMHFTGFSEEVQLGSMGQILESTERVLFVRMYDSDGAELDVEKYAQSLGYDEPLFRGSVLGTYNNGRWVAGSMGREQVLPFSGNQYDGLVRQNFRLKSIGTNLLFAIHPVLGCKIKGTQVRTGHRRFSGVLLQASPGRRPAAAEYTVYSPALSNDAGSPEIPFLPDHFLSAKYQHERDQCKHFPNENLRLSRLQDLARRVSGYDVSPGQRPHQRDMARRLVGHLRDSGEYKYSLDSSLSNPLDDPVEDFLFNRKQGHCEYFASALALMLRSIDIPSRLVNGFKGGETNRLTGEFYVEQRHAHAWVEAYIDGHWMTLDATPADARSESVAGLAPAILSWGDLVSMVKEHWTAYFVKIDMEKQQQQFYDPLRRGVARARDEIRSNRLGNDRNRRSLFGLPSSPVLWFNWQGWAVTLAFLLLLGGAVWLVRRAWRRRKTACLQDERRKAATHIRVDFYERFRRICAELGYAQHKAQTEREFTTALSKSMNAELASAGLGRFPDDLVESFYGIRFGGAALDPQVERQINVKLTEFEQALTNSTHQGQGSRVQG